MLLFKIFDALTKIKTDEIGTATDHNHKTLIGGNTANVSIRRLKMSHVSCQN